MAPERAARPRLPSSLLDADEVAQWKVPRGLRGEMTISISLCDAAQGETDLLAVHEGLPEGLSVEANEEGWRQSLGRLASLVEAHPT
jgi:hypothetical protein